MKSKYQFEILELDDGLVAVPVGNGSQQFHGVLKINETAAAILKLLEHETTEEQIVDELLKQYTGQRNTIATFVREYVENLASESIVE